MTSLATAVTNITKPVTKKNLGPSILGRTALRFVVSSICFLMWTSLQCQFGLPPDPRRPKYKSSIRDGEMRGSSLFLGQVPNRPKDAFKRRTGFSSEIGTKLRDWAVGQAAESCYSRAALSSNDSKTRYVLQRSVKVLVRGLVWNLFLLLLIPPASTCLQHSRNHVPRL